MQDPEFTEVVDLICKEDVRFDRKAYSFVRQALDHTVTELKKTNPEQGKKAAPASAELLPAQKSRHVSGGQLLEGIRSYALEQYGPLAKTVLNAWGITRCVDFGDIVFNLIEYKVFSKTEKDRREDFTALYDFEEAFVRPFQPTRRLRPPLKKADR